jgi:hypothetical protein
LLIGLFKVCPTLVDQRRKLLTTFFAVKMSDTIEIRNALLRSFNVAHEKIMEGKEEFWMAGATTLAAGEVIEIDSENGEWAVIAVCVGDCKLFVWNAVSKTVVDITAGNRLHARNAKDAGGSLGAQKDSSLPDLRNLGSYPNCFVQPAHLVPRFRSP